MAEPSRAKTAASPDAARGVVRSLQTLLIGRPDLQARYRWAKQVVHAFRKPAFYEISQRCNLLCEGCYYFEGGLDQPVPEEKSLHVWEDFFAAEAQRRVSMAYFVGAEPALEQERLSAASQYFPYGNIGTNGTIRIDPSIPYRIGVSVWAGEDETDRRLRGASVFRKAFKSYAGDPRAIILYTLSPWNLDGVRTVAQMCRDHDLPLTFNMYSPTHTFSEKLRRGQVNDDRYFRISQSDHSPCFSKADLARARAVVTDLMQDFPDTIIYSDAYNRWATQEGPLYDLDPETGIANHCGSRIVGQMRYHRPDLQTAAVKCCTSDVDCSQCRMYSGGWSSKFRPTARDVASEGAFSNWLDMMTTLGRIFLYERPEPSVQTRTTPSYADA